MDSAFKFSNGILVADKVSGFRGTIVSRADQIDGYRQYEIQPLHEVEGKLLDSRWFAEGRLETV